MSAFMATSTSRRARIPWLETVEVQESASPYHDWNERITSECYAPNGAARITNLEDEIIRIVNNYSRMSFNFGPTLLSWLKDKAFRAYTTILDADRTSIERYSGHGSAMAQVYNHIIMPLANARDKFTQVVWGIEDFRHRFQRDPEGMWLPEAAVDLATLDMMAEQGIYFTVLSPYQARRIRPLGDRSMDRCRSAAASIPPVPIWRAPIGPLHRHLLLRRPGVAGRCLRAPAR